MPRKTYTTEFKNQINPLVPAGRSPESLAHDFEPSAPTIRGWVADASAGPEVDKHARNPELEKKLVIAEEEREILRKAAAWFAAESASTRKKGSRS